MSNIDRYLSYSLFLERGRVRLICRYLTDITTIPNSKSISLILSTMRLVLQQYPYPLSDLNKTVKSM